MSDQNRLTDCSTNRWNLTTINSGDASLTNYKILSSHAKMGYDWTSYLKKLKKHQRVNTSLDRPIFFSRNHGELIPFLKGQHWGSDVFVGWWQGVVTPKCPTFSPFSPAAVDQSNSREIESRKV